MAFPTVQSAVAKVVMDAKLKVFDDLVTFLDTKIEIDDELKAALAGFKDSLKESEEKAVKVAGKKSKKAAADSSDSSDSEKKKRAPSVFNLFVKDEMPSIKLKNPDVKDGKQLMGLASEQWNTSEYAKFLQSKVTELKKADKDADVHDLFAKAKLMYAGLSDKNADEMMAEKKKVAVTEEKVPKKPTKGASKKSKKTEGSEVESSDSE
jgi:hypothetical protein